MMNPAEVDNIARAEESLWWFQGMREISFALLDPLLRSGQVARVLEGGAGTGYFAEQFASRYGVAVVTLDLDARAVAFCRQRTGVFPVRGNVVALPFRNESFDLVLLLDVLAHTRPGEDAQVLHQCQRVLRPGGYLFVRAAAHRVFRSRHSQFIWEHQRYSARQLRRLAEQANMRLKRMTYANCLLSPVALVKFRIWEPLTRAQPRSGLRPLPWGIEGLARWALHLEAEWIRRGRNLPAGLSLLLLAEKPAAQS